MSEKIVTVVDKDGETMVFSIDTDPNWVADTEYQDEEGNWISDEDEENN
jgi:hypothetical protein